MGPAGLERRGHAREVSPFTGVREHEDTAHHQMTGMSCHHASLGCPCDRPCPIRVPWGALGGPVQPAGISRLRQ